MNSSGKISCAIWFISLSELARIYNICDRSTEQEPEALVRAGCEEGGRGSSPAPGLPSDKHSSKLLPEVQWHGEFACRPPQPAAPSSRGWPERPDIFLHFCCRGSLRLLHVSAQQHSWYANHLRSCKVKRNYLWGYICIREDILFAGDSMFEKPLKPCCVGTSSSYNCGSMDENGSKMYMVCEDPESAFFWDMVHPTQAGWRAVFWRLSATLQQL